MKLFRKLSKWRELLGGARPKRAAVGDARRWPAFERVEPRQMLNATPIQIGAVYTEQDSGGDEHGDRIEITFVGGAPGTELTRLVLNGDQNARGPSVGDMIFDTADGQLGADRYLPFTIVRFVTQDPTASVRATVADGGFELRLDFTGFRAGDRLVLDIDVDEIQHWDPAETDLDLINGGVDPIASGAEFHGSRLDASFTAPHFFDVAKFGTFRNFYDALFAGRGLNLPADNDGGQRDRTAGAAIDLQQLPRPISLAGHVWHDADLDLVRDASESPLAGVTLALDRLDGGTYVPTGFTTVTDASGAYLFSTALNLPPGTYQVREQQPSGYFSVGAVPGTVTGQPTGLAVAGNRDLLSAIAIPLGDTHGVNYDFAEALPASIAGYVYVDRDDDGVRVAGERGLAGVPVDVIAVDTIAPQATVSLLTGTDGSYRATGLAPGRYRVVERSQPAGYYDGRDAAGTVGGQTRGQAVNPGDRIEDILLRGGDAGVEYDFGEIEPASLRGRVMLSDPDGNCDDTTVNYPPLAGVTVQLFDAAGQLVATTTTDANGDYSFTNLRPGRYTIVETTPPEVLDGDAHVGTVVGTPRGQTNGTSRVEQIDLRPGDNGVRYDFCEHEPASLSGRVYHDVNNNGRLEAGESPIGGVVLVLRDLAGQTVATTTTDAQGTYRFDRLSRGTYTIAETQPTGWRDGLDSPGTLGGSATNPGDAIASIPLKFGEHGREYDFGELKNVRLSGHVYEDPDEDCVRDPGEPPIAGVTVRLLDEAGQVVATTTTDSQGRYTFDGLLPGTYTVQEVQPASYLHGGQTVGSHGGIATRDLLSNVRLLSGDDATDYDFCELRPVSLAGWVYHDLANDGSRAGDPGLAGVTLRIEPIGSSPQAAVTVTTDATGFYEATGLWPGQYRVVEQHPAGYEDGLDSAGTVGGVVVGRAVNPGDRIEDIRLTSGQRSIENNFGEFLRGAIRGRVLLTDTNGDCDHSAANQRVVSGATILLQDAAGRELARTTTGADGTYAFTALLPGSYRVVEITPAGLFDGDEHVGSIRGVTVGRVAGNDTLADLVLRSGDESVDNDFCEHPAASLAGHVYHDENDNGQRDVGESPIGSVEVTLRDASGRTVGTTRTAADGTYAFTGLAAGVYEVVESHPTGWLDGRDRAGTVNGRAVGSATNPGDRIGAVQLGWGERGVDYDFGELLAVSITGRVHADRDGDCVVDPGEPLLAGVTIRLLDAAGNVLATTTTDSTGTYRFTGLRPGTYGVQEVQPAGYFHGDQEAGSHGGNDAVDDLITAITLRSGQNATDYDFCELEPASLSGRVHADRDGDCAFDPGEAPLAGVTIRLLDAAGNVVRTTTTDAAGQYRFEGLAPNARYSVQEVQPAGYFHLGQDAGSHGGSDAVDDLIANVLLPPNARATDYDFCEEEPASLAGNVWVDPDRDLRIDAGEQKLAGVHIDLVRGGTVIASTQTDATGRYRFDNLRPGTYEVRETQPAGWLQSGQRAGSRGGEASRTDVLSAIPVGAGEHLTDYDFAEIPPASISGLVHADTDGDCELDPGEKRLDGVLIELLDEFDRLVASTRTDAQGRYAFTNLAPGNYTVRETQPVGYFDGGQRAGRSTTTGSGSGGTTGGNLGGAIGHQTVGGLEPVGGSVVQTGSVVQAVTPDTSVPNRISRIQLAPGEQRVDYDFCELPPATLSGFVFQDGPAIETEDGLRPANLRDLRDGLQTADDRALGGVLLELRTVLGTAFQADRALPGTYPPGPIRTTTDARGYYEFRGLRPGAYAVYEVQPDGYIDSKDTAGTLGGFAVNEGEVVTSPQFVSVLAQLTLEASTHPRNDAILLINLAAGQDSRLNNFSEVLVVKQPPLIPPPPAAPQPQPPLVVLPPLANLPTPRVFVVAPPVLPERPLIPLSAPSMRYTWHLSIVNAGAPRGDYVTYASAESEPYRRTHLVGTDWNATRMHGGRWLIPFRDTDGTESIREVSLGVKGGVPVVGDFNGDGLDDLGVFLDGEWFLDVNGNGRWDDGDLWARLGAADDMPVTGDWDGDGKTDIGIFGLAWRGDDRAIAREPGLPDPHNARPTAPKNMPPPENEATNGVRRLRLTEQGTERADLIDHVFQYGTLSDVPVRGDWNGDGIPSIGIFRDGEWRLDTNGDGRWDAADETFRFGLPGDVPVVGDVDGDGKDEVGVFRNGVWIFDTNHNHQLDAGDQVHHVGGPGDRPVVGDFDGDGTDEPAVFVPDREG